jgi:hypothetical protein
MDKKETRSEMPGISRRKFGRSTVLVLAGSTLAPASLISSGAALPAIPQQGQGGELAESVRAEIESKVQNVMTRWGSRLRDDQKTRIRTIITRHVRMLETIRAYPLENGDSPASVLKLVENRSVPGMTRKGEPSRNSRQH